MANPETVITLGTQDTGQRLEKTKGEIKNGQSRNEFLDCLYPVSCVPNVVRVSGLSLSCVPNVVRVSGLSLQDTG
jgi:hypothetical protein